MVRSHRFNDLATAQFAYYLNGILRQFEYAYSQYQLGYLSDDSWQAIDQIIEQNFAPGAVRKYWSHRNSSFSLEFGNYIRGLDAESFPESSESVLKRLQSD